MHITRIVLRVDDQQGMSECHIKDIRFRHAEEQIAFGIALCDRAFLPPVVPAPGFEASIETLRGLRFDRAARRINAHRISPDVASDLAGLLDTIQHIDQTEERSCRVLTTYPPWGSSELSRSNPRKEGHSCPLSATNSSLRA